jgi:hypothetical protein
MPLHDGQGSVIPEIVGNNHNASTEGIDSIS